MSELYRIKFRAEQFEVELESTDKGYISNKMIELISLSTGGGKSKVSAAASRSVEAPSTSEPAASSSEAAPLKKAVAKAKASGAKRGPKPKAKATGAKRGPKPKIKSAVKKAASAAASDGPKSSLDAKAVASSVKASPHYNFIKTKILDKSNQINRILISFYYSPEVNDGHGLTTGEVETITEALGNTIKSTNISSQLKKYDDLFITKGERKRGSVVYYKLNAKGRKKLEDLLSTAA